MRLIRHDKVLYYTFIPACTRRVRQISLFEVLQRHVDTEELRIHINITRRMRTIKVQACSGAVPSSKLSNALRSSYDTNTETRRGRYRRQCYKYLENFMKQHRDDINASHRVTLAASFEEEWPHCVIIFAVLFDAARTQNVSMEIQPVNASSQPSFYCKWDHNFPYFRWKGVVNDLVAYDLKLDLTCQVCLLIE